MQAEQVVLEVSAENNTRYNKHRGCVVKQKLLKLFLFSILETFKVINAAKRQTPINRKHKKCFPTKKIMQDNRKNWRSVGINVNKCRHTISRMPGKRHRKSLYCRHREQLWGDKKGNWYYWDCWYQCLPVCLFVCMCFLHERKKRKTEWERELACRFTNICVPTNMRGNESSLNKQRGDRLSEKVNGKVVE